MASDEGDSDLTSSTDGHMEPLLPTDPSNKEKPAHFVSITENIYLREKYSNKERKKAKKMICECAFDARVDDPSNACGPHCLNRLLMIECGSRCPCGAFCSNKRFQKAEYVRTEVFKTEQKGWGLRALEDIPSDTFIMEYCGEVCTAEEFVRRKKEYHKDNRRHYYFMSLKSDEILDATRKGNLSRFINHSCDPNCETQKWTVNGLLRVGFFSIQEIKSGEELTFDYKFERFGEVAQKCFCGSANCRGLLGGSRPKESKRVEAYATRENKRKDDLFEGGMDEMEQTIYDIVGQKMKLVHQKQVLPLSRAMIQAESPKHRILFLKVLQETGDIACLKRFMSYQGLPLLWSWMVDSSDLPLTERVHIKLQLLRTLKCLPISSRNQLEENRILSLVQRWASGDEAAKEDAIDLAVLKKNELVDSSHPVKEELIDSTHPTKEEPIDSTHPVEEEPIDSTHYVEGKSDDSTISEARLVDSTHSGEELGDSTHQEKDGVDTVCDEPNGLMVVSAPEHGQLPVGSVDHTSNEIVRNRGDKLRVQEGGSEDCQQDSLTGTTLHPVDAAVSLTKDIGDISKLAKNLILEWNELKEIFRIPKKSKSLHRDPMPGGEKSTENALFVKNEDLRENASLWPSPLEHYRKRKDFDSRERRYKRHRFSPPTHRQDSPSNIPSLPPLQSSYHTQSSPISHHHGNNNQPVSNFIPPQPFVHPIPGTVPHTQSGQCLVAIDTTSNDTLGFFPPQHHQASFGLPRLQEAFHAKTIPQPTDPGGMASFPETQKTLDVDENGALPNNWKMTFDASGNSYYYHVLTRKSQWERPTAVHESEENPIETVEMTMVTPSPVTPIQDETPVGKPGMPRTPEESPPITEEEESTEKVSSTTNHSLAKDSFRHQLSRLVVHCLNKHRKPDCKSGKITNLSDFKHLARKLTHTIIEKEATRKGGRDNLQFADSVRHKTKEFIRAYMKKCGPVYKRV